MSLIDCIQAVCAEVERTNTALEKIRIDSQSILNEMGNASGVFYCVINGPIGGYCNTGTRSHLTVAEALSRLNRINIESISPYSFLAEAGQTDFNLAVEVINPATVEVSLNGSLCADPVDYTVTSDGLIVFTYSLVVDDEVSVRVFSP